jgi:hypothetical protein
VEPDPPPSPPGTEPSQPTAPLATQPISEQPSAPRQRRVWPVALAFAAVVLAVVGGVLGAMAALGVVHFGDARSPKAAAAAATTVTTTPGAERAAQIRFPDRLGGFRRTSVEQTTMFPGAPAIPQLKGSLQGHASYGTDAAHPALNLAVSRPPEALRPRGDMAESFISDLDALNAITKSLSKDKDMWPQGSKPPTGAFYSARDFHTFEHGGVAYRCANAKRAKSDSRPGMCVFYDRHTDTLVVLQGNAPREGDAARLSEIADEARRALDTI